MNSVHTAALPPPATAIPWRVAPPLISTALLMLGSGFLGSLLPLRFSAMGMSDGVIGLIATAEALGFLAGCLYAHKVIAPVGLERAYATFAGVKSVAILGLYFADGVPMLAVLRFLIGINAAGLAIIVESWLNALVPNEQRGRVLTIYVLVYGLFFGVGQLFSQSLDVRGPQLLFIAGIATTLALVPMVAIDVRAPVLPHRLKLDLIKALRTSPVSVTACLLNGLILTAFTTVGPLFGVRIGFDQQHIVLLMACVSLGGLFLQWPIGYFSDKIDRLHALIGLGVGILAVAAALVWADRRMPFVLLALLFGVFGGLAESLYAVGVAHANDRAAATDYVALSSTLLFVWALGSSVGPTAGTYAIQLITPRAFFVYVMILTLAFTVFAIWRLWRRKVDPIVESREEFLAYPQTSPEIYEWLPYHRDTVQGGERAQAEAVVPPSGSQRSE
ncbi:MAG TPA: MFS transporter [Steroidobacteraceae bacterium]|jgi:MFS family permease|nr:MFS transporter [Steroidobacteraceae bacterium]